MNEIQLPPHWKVVKLGDVCEFIYGKTLPKSQRESGSMTHRGKSYLSGRASNAADGKFNINTQTIKAVLVPIAPIDEQHEIIGTLQACDRKISSLEKEITLIDELFRAMLEQLMTGKISTQPLTETYV